MEGQQKYWSRVMRQLASEQANFDARRQQEGADAPVLL
jgi:hypothetical protein